MANVARQEGVGAFVLEASSQANAKTGPENAIDFSAKSSWQTETGQVTNQWIKIRLIEGGPYLVNKVLLTSSTGSTSPKDLEIRVSNQTLNDADFTTPSKVLYTMAPEKCLC